jgi:hypothetical protein
MCRLLGATRTQQKRAKTDAIDPTATLAAREILHVLDLCLPTSACIFDCYNVHRRDLGGGYEAARFHNRSWRCGCRLPLAARAQEKGRVYRIGNLFPTLDTRKAPYFVAFYNELRRQGFVEGQNLAVDEQGFGLQADQFPEHAAELARAQVDVIMCAGEPTIRIAQQATKSIPIVANGADLVGSAWCARLPSLGAM